MKTMFQKDHVGISVGEDCRGEVEAAGLLKGALPSFSEK